MQQKAVLAVAPMCVSNGNKKRKEKEILKSGEV